MIRPIGFSRAFFHTLLLNSLSKVIALSSGVIIARSLGPDGRGEISMIIAVVTVLSLLGSIVNGANEILMGEDNKRQRPLVMQTILWAGLLSLFMMMLIINVPDAILIYIFDSSVDTLQYLFPLLFFFFIAEEGVRRILLAIQDFKYINHVSLFSTIFYVLSVLIFIGVFDFGVFEVILIHIMQQFLSFAAYLVRIKFMHPILVNESLKESLFKKAVPIGTRSLLLGVPTILLLQSDILLIKYFTNSTSVGLYQISISISIIILTIPSLLSLIIRSKAVSEQNNYNSTLLIAKMYVVCAVLTVILFYFFGESLISVLFGEVFLDSYFPALLLLMGIVFWGYGDILVGYINAKLKYPIFIPFGFFLALIINIALNVLFIPTYGFIAAAWSSLVSYIVMAIVCAYKFKLMDNITIKKLIWFDSHEINRLRQFLRKQNV